MKLTPSQLKYLRSAAINPTGRTVVPWKTREKLEQLGLMTHAGFSITTITEAGRKAVEGGEDE